MAGHDALGTVGGAAGASFLSIFKGKACSLERAQKVIFVPSIESLKTAPHLLSLMVMPVFPRGTAIPVQSWFPKRMLVGRDMQQDERKVRSVRAAGW